MARGDFRPAENRDRAPVYLGYRPNAKSSTILWGEPVCISTASGLTTASNPVARTLLAADIAALYLQGSPIAGIFGFCTEEAVTSSGGVANTQTGVYSGKSASAEPISNIPSYGFGLPPDPNISYSELQIAIAYPGQVFRGALKTGTASNLSLGLAGIDLTSSTFTVDPSATTKILNIIGWDQQVPIGGTINHVYFEVLPAYCQILTGVNYSSQ